jgi:hypothetical protein
VFFVLKLILLVGSFRGVIMFMVRPEYILCAFEHASYEKAKNKRNCQVSHLEAHLLLVPWRNAWWMFLFVGNAVLLLLITSKDWYLHPK